MLPPTQSPLGLQFVKEDVILSADSDILKGQVCVLTLDATNLVFDAAAPAIAATGEFSAAGQFQFFGVALEDIATGKKGSFRLRGKVEALGGDTSAASTGLSVGAGSELVAAPFDPNANANKVVRVLAVNLEQLADGVLKEVIFDGLNGFGLIEAA